MSPQLVAARVWCQHALRHPSAALFLIARGVCHRGRLPRRVQAFQICILDWCTCAPGEPCLAFEDPLAFLAHKFLFLRRFLAVSCRSALSHHGDPARRSFFRLLLHTRFFSHANEAHFAKQQRRLGLSPSLFRSSSLAYFGRSRTAGVTSGGCVATRSTSSTRRSKA
ncbi:hypothetical protein TRVL_08885 [Trypanosoma vivax]|nr:hypothetical protein TRVL_08885 [Trypanosoma vivax]